MASIVVAASDLSALVAQLPADAQAPGSGLLFTFDADDVTKGTLAFPDEMLALITEASSAASLASGRRQQLLNYASIVQEQLLAQVWTFAVPDASGANVALSTKLDDKGQASMTQLLVWSGYADAQATEPYSNDDFTSATLTPAMARSLALPAGVAKASTYAALNAISEAIMASPPSIVDTAQIDAAQWPKP